MVNITTPLVTRNAELIKECVCPPDGFVILLGFVFVIMMVCSLDTPSIPYLFCTRCFNCFSSRKSNDSIKPDLFVNDDLETPLTNNVT